MNNIDYINKICINAKLSSKEISSFSIGVENLKSDILEGRTGSSYKVLIGIQK